MTDVLNTIVDGGMVGNGAERKDVGVPVRSTPTTQPRRPPFPTPEPSSRTTVQQLATVSNPTPTTLPASASTATPPSVGSNTQSTPSAVTDSPLPFLPVLTSQVSTLRAGLKRRRSSFPPATLPTSTNQEYPWVVGGTPATVKPAWNIALPVPVVPDKDHPDLVSDNPTPSFSTLLHFDPTPLHTPTNLLSSILEPPYTLSSTGESSRSMWNQLDMGGQPQAGPSSSPLRPTKMGDVPRSPGAIARFGSDLAWKTILGSVVDVEGVGEVEVTKVMLEVWRRGGGDLVTAQNLWLNIVIALQLPSHNPGARIPSASATAAEALQKVYNLTLRPWEAAIFSGLLASYSSTSQPSHVPALNQPSVSSPYFGPSTPTKELDLSMWTNFSPGTGDLGSAMQLGAGTTPKHSVTAPSGLGQFEFHAEDDRRPSDTAESMSGLEALLAEMEEGNAAKELEAAMKDQPPYNGSHLIDEILASVSKPLPSRKGSLYQLPTPETDGTSPSISGGRQISSAPVSSHPTPENPASPFVTASTISSSVSKVSQAVTSTERPQEPTASTSRANPPNSLTMPTSTFVPPPPMCMFFSPQFRDLEKGKVGVWKGDLEISGKGGGKFSILIVGEEGTGHLWQSHLWPTTIKYPSDPRPDTQQGACTSTMIPVAHLAREGFTPVTMGMVLCNDSNISAYVQMVQGFHAEGVAFHLNNPARLPIVFLPAKFDSADPLQRLGIAFMSKPGLPVPKPIPTADMATQANSTSQATSVDEKKRKRQRRQSAPAKTNTGHRRRRSSTTAERTLSSVLSVQEEAIVEE